MPGAWPRRRPPGGSPIEPSLPPRPGYPPRSATARAGAHEPRRHDLATFEAPLLVEPLTRYEPAGASPAVLPLAFLLDDHPLGKAVHADPQLRLAGSGRVRRRRVQRGVWHARQ